MLRAVLSASGYLIFALCEQTSSDMLRSYAVGIDASEWVSKGENDLQKKSYFSLTANPDFDSLEKFAQNVTRF